MHRLIQFKEKHTCKFSFVCLSLCLPWQQAQRKGSGRLPAKKMLSYYLNKTASPIKIIHSTSVFAFEKEKKFSSRFIKAIQFHFRALLIFSYNLHMVYDCIIWILLHL